MKRRLRVVKRFTSESLISKITSKADIEKTIKDGIAMELAESILKDKTLYKETRVRSHQSDEMEIIVEITIDDGKDDPVYKHEIEGTFTSEAPGKIDAEKMLKTWSEQQDIKNMKDMLGRYRPDLVTYPGPIMPATSMPTPSINIDKYGLGPYNTIENDCAEEDDDIAVAIGKDSEENTDKKWWK